MKKVSIFLYSVFAIFSIILLTGCGNVSNIQNKTEYYIGEEANIDNYLITCNDYEILGKKLKVNLILTNKNKQTKTVSFKNNFSIYNIDGSENIPENISNDEVKTIESGKSMNIYLEFDFNDYDINTDELRNYKILFYSGVATNNIAFILEEV